MKIIQYSLLLLLLAILVACKHSQKHTQARFKSLNYTLERSIEALNKQLEASLEALKTDVKKEGNTLLGIALVKKGDLLKKSTATLIVQIEKLKQALIQQDSLHKKEDLLDLLEPSKHNQIKKYLKENLAKELAKAIEVYRKNIRTNFPQNLKDFEVFTQLNESFIKKKIIEDFIYTETTLALLSQKETTILAFENKLLEELSNSVKGSSSDPNFDEVRAFASAKSTVVKEGDLFQLEILLARIGKNIPLKMTANGQPIEVKDGIGKVRIPCPQVGEFSWRGTVSLKLRGKDTTFTVEKRYSVIPDPRKKTALTDSTNHDLKQ